MSSLTTLARPYAKAAFEVARSAGQLAEWGAALESTAAAVAVPAMGEALDAPGLGASQAVDLVLEAGGNPDNSGFRRFLDVLAENERLSLLPQVSELYAVLRQEAENRLDVRVVSAVALDEDQSGRLGAALEQRFERSVAVHNDVDPTLLGGAVIYAGDEVIDGSVLGRLKRLQGSLA
ncbi:MAG: F0F1 ATP synthase subunit delta [Pseudomonadota bacterium]